jgi:hypothetical protein
MLQELKMLCHSSIFVLCINRWMVTPCVTLAYVPKRFGYGEFPKEPCIFINFITIPKFSTCWTQLDMGRNQWINLTTYYRTEGNKVGHHTFGTLGLFYCFHFVQFLRSLDHMFLRSHYCALRALRSFVLLFFFFLPWCIPIVPMCNSMIYCRTYEESSDMFGPIDGFQYVCYSSHELPHIPSARPCYVNDKEKGVAWTKLIMIIRT